MLNENGNTRDLAELLHSHREQIRDAWVKKVLAEPDTYYQRVSREEVSAWAANGVAEIIEILETNSNQVIEKYIEEIAFSRLEIGFPIYEVTNGLLLAKEVILPIVWSSRSAGSIDFIDSVVQLDACLRKIINEFEKLFSQKVHHQLLDESRKKLVESEAMQRTITALLHGLALDEVLEIVCSEAQKLTDAAGSAVLLLEDEEWLRVTISTGDLQPALERLPVQGSFAGKVLQERSPQLINFPVGKFHAYHRNPDLKALIVVPLHVDGKSIGVIDVANKKKDFADEDLRIIKLFADYAAIAIGNARLHQESEKLVVIEERQRLARELHDSVTQSLYSVTLFADAARLALLADNEAEAIKNLYELRNMAREAMLDMRLLIFELHPPILEKEGLVAAIKTRLESVEARSGIETQLIIEGERRLPLSIESELYRISQEALNNVVKHAKAHSITVKILFEKRGLLMEIWDDGKGFDPITASHSRGMGLRGIKERAQKIHGELSVNSVPGKGTTILIEVEV